MFQFPRIVGTMLVGAILLLLVVFAPAAARVCAESLMAGATCNLPPSSSAANAVDAARFNPVPSSQPVAFSLSDLAARYLVRQPSSLGASNRPSGGYQATTTYVVVFGDNLYRISLRFGTTVQAIMQANPSIVDPNRIYGGQVLVIPVGSTAVPLPAPLGTATPQPTYAAGTIVYTVVRGDHLYRIALRYGTTVSAIVRANPFITNPDLIFPGQVLVIPSAVIATPLPAPIPTATPPVATPLPAPIPTETPTTAPTSPVTSPTPVTSTPAATATVTATPAMTATAGPTSSISTTVNLAAANVAFNPTSITVPAAAHVVVNFTNQDPVPHNFAVYTNNTAQQVIFRGQVITGPNVMATYEFTAPAQPGTYFFRCDIHPAQMMGQFIVQ